MVMNTPSTKDPDGGTRRRVVSLSTGLHAKPAAKFKPKPKPTATQKRRALKRKKDGKAEG